VELNEIGERAVIKKPSYEKTDDIVDERSPTEAATTESGIPRFTPDATLHIKDESARHMLLTQEVRPRRRLCDTADSENDDPNTKTL
jgi:hypothetical protein